MKKPTDQAQGAPKIKKPRKGKAPKATDTGTPPPAFEQTSETPLPETPPPQTPEVPTTLEESETEEPFTAPITLESLQHQIDSLNVQLQELLARKRKPPVSSGRVQILDKLTGNTYRSKNNAYKTLLKSGDLKELVDKGVFGADPAKNTFGWYALARAFPAQIRRSEAREPGTRA